MVRIVRGGGSSSVLAVFDCCIIVGSARDSRDWCDLSWRSASSTLSPLSSAGITDITSPGTTTRPSPSLPPAWPPHWRWPSRTLDLTGVPRLEADQAGNWAG